MPRLIDADAIPWCSYDLDNYHWFEGVDKEVVDEMPTIDPESLRPHGRWEKSGDYYCGLALLECSLCRGECFDIDEDIELLNYRYCPNCGAKMDEEE